MEPLSAKPLYRFGVYEADEQAQELRKHGRPIRLPGQPYQILLMLLARPGEVITREAIRQRLWPDGTFVDFDHSLNSAVNKLRDTLSDSAAKPRYIETVARRGYRFLAAVEVLSTPLTTGDALQNGVPAPEPGSPASEARWGGSRAIPAKREPPSHPWSLLTSREDLPSTEHISAARTLFLLAQVMYLCFYIAALANLAEIQQILAVITVWHLQLFIALIASSAVGIALRLFLLSAVGFRTPGFEHKFLRLFPALLLLDCAWALAPLLMASHIGIGLAFAATAALLLVPFGERTLVLMLNRD